MTFYIPLLVALMYYYYMTWTILIDYNPCANESSVEQASERGADMRASKDL
jgi:hypothetical protein